VRPLESSESDFGAFFVSCRFATFRSFLPPRGFRHFNRLQTFAVFSPARFFPFVVPPPELAFVSPGRSSRLSLRSPFPRRNSPSFRRDVRRVFLCVLRSPAGTRFRFAETFAAVSRFAFASPPDKKTPRRFAFPPRRFQFAYSALFR